MTIVIGLLGPAGAGKSTIASYLEREFGAKRYSLASLLKEVARRTLGFSHEQLYGTQAQKEAVDPRYGFSPRWFLQRLGTEGCRAVFGKDFWIEQLSQKIAAERSKYAVVDDLRFANEVDFFTSRFGYVAATCVWRIHPPPDAEAAQRLAAAGRHASETEWLTVLGSEVLEIRPSARGVPELERLAFAAAYHSGLRSPQLFKE